MEFTIGVAWEDHGFGGVACDFDSGRTECAVGTGGVMHFWGGFDTFCKIGVLKNEFEKRLQGRMFTILHEDEFRVMRTAVLKYPYIEVCRKEVKVYFAFYHLKWEFPPCVEFSSVAKIEAQALADPETFVKSFIDRIDACCQDEIPKVLSAYRQDHTRRDERVEMNIAPK